MVSVLFTLTLIFNIVIALKDKYSKEILIFTFVFLTLFIAGNNSNPDYLSYANEYKLMMTSGNSYFNDYGFIFLEKFFIQLGFNFNLFRLIITIVCLILIYKGITYYKINIHYIISLYMLYQLIMDTIQFRNFIGMAIVIYSLHFIIERNKNDLLRFFICIIIATTIHSSMCVFIILPLSNFLLKKSKYIKYISFVILILCILCFFQSNIIEIFDYVLKCINKEYLIQYYASGSGKSYAFILPLLSFLGYYIIYAICRRNKDIKNNEEFTLIKHMFIINIISMFFMPLVITSASWYRIIRNLNILNYIFSYKCIKFVDNKMTKNFLVISSYSIVFLWSIIELIIWIGIDKVIIMFQNNIFL